MNQLEREILEGLLGEPYELSVRNAGIFRFPSAYRFRGHSHRDTEMVYINSGHCIMGVEEEFVPLKQGDFISIAPGKEHCFVVDNRENCRITQLEFRIQTAEGVKKALPFLYQKRSYEKLSECETIRGMMEGICRIFRGPGGKEEKETQMLFGFLQLFIELSSRFRSGKQENGKAGRIQEILRYLNENYERAISLEEMAKRFHLSSRYIRQCFLKEVDRSPQQYITALRIGKAKEYLWYTSDSITEIALKTGFGSSQYFSRVFQQHTDMTPSEYRNLWQGSKAEELCQMEL